MCEVKGYETVGGLTGGSDNCAIKNCYTTGAVSGNRYVGGITGALNSGSLLNSVALNPSVKGDLNTGRIAGINNGDGMLSGNAAFSGILNKGGNTTWDNIGTANLDGENMSKESIQAEGSLGGRFNTAGGWTTLNGKLPGLFGNTVNMPVHLGGVGVASTTLSNRITVYPNPTTGELRITNYELGIGALSEVEVFDIYGRKHEGAKGRKGEGEIVLDVSNLTAGVYFLKINNEVVKVIKN
jgi:hypothetical protein